MLHSKYECIALFKSCDILLILLSYNDKKFYIYSVYCSPSGWLVGWLARVLWRKVQSAGQAAPNNDIKVEKKWSHEVAPTHLLKRYHYSYSSFFLFFFNGDGFV